MEETSIYYEKNVMDIIRKSKNVMIWILNKYDELNTQLEDFKCDMIENVYVLKRQ